MTNKVDIQEGNQNVVIQGVKFSKIDVVINSLDMDELKEQLTNLLDKREPLTIFILTTVWDRLQKHISNNKVFEDNYHKQTEDWKPFSNEKRLLELLNEYRQRSGYKLNVFILDCIDAIPSDDLIDDVKAERNHIVWIVDSFALCCGGNKKLAKILDEPLIGGCLIPCDDKLKEDSENYQIHKSNTATTFRSLTNFTENYYNKFLGKKNDEGFIHVDLEVRTKHTLFRRLTAIAYFRLKRDRHKNFNAFGNKEITLPS